MDPTFGGQELLESLSQSSTKSRTSRGGSSKASANSSLASASSNPVEDAYRRIGQGLSQRAGGNDGGVGGALGQQQYSGGGGGGGNHHLRLPGPSTRHQARSLGTHPCTSFRKFQRPAKKPFNPHAAIAAAGHHPNPPQGGPSPKIAKTGGSFQDHHNTSHVVDPGGSSGGIGESLGGSAGASASNKPSQRILKKITMQAKETFVKWRRQQKAGYLNKFATTGTLSTSASSGQTSTTSLGTSAGGLGASYDQYGRLTEQQLLQQQQQHGPHNGAGPGSYDSHGSYSQMSLQQQQQFQQQQQQLSLHNQSQHNAQEGGPKGLLSAVLEGGSDSAYESESVHSLPTINSKAGKSVTSMASSVRSGQASNSYHQYPGPSSQASAPPPPQQPALHFATPRGQCLTLPADPVGNDGLDNMEGNMILHKNDILVVPGRNTSNNAKTSSSSTTSDRNAPPRGLEFHVQSMLGQGTFAQVFCCWESVSKKHVALKIIKNKPAFTKQAAVEIEVFQALAAKSKNQNDPATAAVEAVGGSVPASPHMVQLLSSFMYKSHLCLVFELLGLNLYEVLKRRQFRGLPLPMVRTLVRQALEGVKELASKTIVHCDLKPENILLVGEEAEREVVGGDTRQQSQQQKDNTNSNNNDTMSTSGSCLSLASMASVTSTATTKKIPQTIKLIDFGSACFEGFSAHTYIQSRFYRSPEVLMGLPYDSAIDMWSLGCVAAELFLGLPILPGVHEHDQCGRISEMIGVIPDWMLEQGTKASKYYVKFVPHHKPGESSHGDSNTSGDSDPLNKAVATPSSSSTDVTSNQRLMMPQWRLKTQDEYIKSLTQNEIRKKGGLAKLEKQPTNRYFKRTKLSDIIMLHGQHCVGDEKELLTMFVHFLYGLLDPDPWKRWTAYQASQHPFVTGIAGQLRKKTASTKIDYKEENQANIGFDLHWAPPWDPGICRRKLLNVQRMREKQNAQRRGYAQPRSSSHVVDGHDNMDMRSASRQNQKSPSMMSVGSRQPMMVADSPSVGHMSVDGKVSPPSNIASQLALHAQRGRAAGSMPKGASSLTALGNSGLQAALGMEHPSRHEHHMQTPTNLNSSNRSYAGAQSYTGLGYENDPADADFALALQRPGNVPGLGSDATVASQASIGSGLSLNSGQPHHLQHQQQQQQQYGRMPQNSLSRYAAGNSASSVNSLPSGTGYSNQPGMMGAGGVSYQGYGNSFDQGGIQYLAAQQQLQKQRAREEQQQQPRASDQLPPHMMGTEYHHQLLMQEQQKQLAALQEQHQRQLAQLQQQQQLAFQQQQQQFMSQQYGPTGTGNGYYYVTSADGTPMLMQQPGAPGGQMGDGSGYMMPPQQRTTSFDDGGGGGSRSVRDNRSNRQQMPRGGGGGRGGGNGNGGGYGMSM